MYVQSPSPANRRVGQDVHDVYHYHARDITPPILGHRTHVIHMPHAPTISVEQQQHHFFFQPPQHRYVQPPQLPVQLPRIPVESYYREIPTLRHYDQHHYSYVQSGCRPVRRCF